MSIKVNDKKGITIIALVITIIVLLILSGVTISMLTNENGIIKKALYAKKQTERAEAKEIIEIEVLDSLVKSGTLDMNKIKEKLETKLKIPSIDINDNLDGSIDVKYNNVELVVKTNGEVIYKEEVENIENEKLPITENTAPYLPKGAVVTNNNLNTGVTIRDSNKNEWVWIEVPKSIYINIEYNNNNNNKPKNSSDYINIEMVMHKYTEKYRNGTANKDIWYSKDQHGFESASEYNTEKNKILKSIYEYGGFYIGKYEVGTEKLRSLANEELTTPVIKEGAYPYNNLTCLQAQQKAKELSNGGRTSSLMLGVQWDLVLKYIEIKKGKTFKELNEDSSLWGNYKDSSYSVTKGRYSEDSGKTFTKITNNYLKEKNKPVLLTTGAIEEHSILNIYDFAGNLSEWILEYASNTNSSCTSRGGDYTYNGSEIPSSSRGGDETAFISNNIGFRPTLY